MAKGQTMLSRDSRFGQRIDHAFAVEVGDGGVDGFVKCGGVGAAVLNATDSHSAVPLEPDPRLNESDLQQVADFAAVSHRG